MFLRPFFTFAAFVGGLCFVSASETIVTHHEHVLGTSLEIQLQVDSEQTATVAEAAILKEIQRLSAIFSTYDANSEFSHWQQTNDIPVHVSAELCQVLSLSQQWTQRSHGTFQPAVDELSQLWRSAEKNNALPTNEDVARIVKDMKQTHWKLDPTAGTATHLTTLPLSLNAIAKGAIVERAIEKARAIPGVNGLVVNLGGDLRVCGDSVQEVNIADPSRDAENARPLDRIFVSNRAVATSGNYRRGFQINGQWHSHILDPRTGQPGAEIVSATVVAQSSADADALATICNVLTPHESMALVGTIDGAECLVITRDGQQHQSSGWKNLQSPHLYRYASSPAAMMTAFYTDEKSTNSEGAEKKAEVKPEEPVELLELVVNFELNRPEGGQYRRPYVAVWLEDEDEFPVRTALLWMQTKSPGPRWHRDLLRWYRNDAVRKLASDAELIGTISAATRGPGEYKAVFDGRDDAGVPLKPGKYTLFIEAAREHGTYQLIRETIELATESIDRKELKGNVEISAADYHYAPFTSAATPSDNKNEPAATKAQVTK